MSYVSQFSRLLYVFRKPTIKESFDFEQCFYCSSGEESVNEFVKDITRTRKQMQDALVSPHMNSMSTLETIDAYLPLLWQLFDSLERQEPVKVETPLRFVWCGSVIVNFPRLDSIPYGDIIFELIMTLHSKGVVTANAAAEIAESDPSAVNTAAKCLREASAIMKFLASSLIPRWHTKSNYRYVPPETNSLYCEYLSDFFTACSNQMCAAKALQNNTTPPTLLTSLCLSVVRSMESCLSNLASSGFSLKDTDGGSRDHVGVMREFFSALVYRYQAESFMKKNETGIVIALCAVVQARLHATSKSKVYDPFTPQEFPKSSAQSPALRSALEELNESVASLRKTAEEENKLVYFKSIPRDTADLPELPPPTVLNLPTAPYVPPTSKVMRFSYDSSRKQTIFNSFAKMFTRSSGPSDTDAKKEEAVDEKEELSDVLETPPPLERDNSSASTSSTNGVVDENSVKRLVDMGFVADVSREMLIKHNGNETAAINELLSK